MDNELVEVVENNIRQLRSTMIRLMLVTFSLASIVAVGVSVVTNHIKVVPAFMYVILIFVGYTVIWDELYECK